MKKTPLLLVALLITCSSIYSQKIVQSKEISVGGPQIQVLESSFEKFGRDINETHKVIIE